MATWEYGMAEKTNTAFGRGVRVGRVGGVRVTLHWSVVLMVGLVTVLLATSELPAAQPGHARPLYWVVGAAAALLFLASIAAHELAHALVARHFGMRAERMTLWMLGGLTELGGEPPSPRADAWVAGAGPLTTVALGLTFAGVATVLGPSVAAAGFVWLAVMSAVLAAFNLLPGAPLDGGRLLRALVWRVTHDRGRAVSVAASTGRFLGMFLVAIGLLGLLAGDAMGIWLAMIGWFIVTGAGAEQYTARLERLAGLCAHDVMAAAPLTFPSWWTAAAARQHVAAANALQPAFPMIDIEGRTIGAITLADLHRVSTGAAEQLRLDRIRPAVSVPLVSAEARLSDVARAMGVRSQVAVVVDDFGRPLGVIDQGILARASHLTALKA
jgi:Zn-dependent protease